jgi:hypothetical protein
MRLADDAGAYAEIRAAIRDIRITDHICSLDKVGDSILFVMAEGSQREWVGVSIHYTFIRVGVLLLTQLQ